MERKYSIVINNIQNDLYALVLKSWLLDNDNKEYDIKTETMVGISLTHCITITQNFINNGN